MKPYEQECPVCGAPAEQVAKSQDNAAEWWKNECVRLSERIEQLQQERNAFNILCDAAEQNNVGRNFAYLTEAIGAVREAAAMWNKGNRLVEDALKVTEFTNEN